jgi:hypothetical protein
MAHIYHPCDVDQHCNPVVLSLDTPEGELAARIAVRDYGGEYAEIYVGEPGTPDEHKSGNRLFAAPADLASLVPSLDDQRTLRNVTFSSGLTTVADHRLHIWETGKRCHTGQWEIGYAFYPAGASEPLFAGDDYGCAPSDAIDSDACLLGIISFLCLKPGDTDDEYFAEYTEAQLDWATSYAAETLAILPYDAELSQQNDSEAYYSFDDDGTFMDSEGEPVFVNLESEG